VAVGGKVIEVGSMRAASPVERFDWGTRTIVQSRDATTWEA
jgi:hypothetical protein